MDSMINAWKFQEREEYDQKWSKWVKHNERLQKQTVILNRQLCGIDDIIQNDIDKKIQNECYRSLNEIMDDYHFLYQRMKARCVTKNIHESFVDQAPSFYQRLYMANVQMIKDHVEDIIVVDWVVLDSSRVFCILYSISAASYMESEMPPLELFFLFSLKQSTMDFIKENCSLSEIDIRFQMMQLVKIIHQ